MKRVWGVVGGLSLLCLATVAQAQPTAEQVLTDTGLSAGDRQNVMNGQFVNVSVSGVSERDLAFGIAFLVKTSPESLAKQIEAGELITADTQVKAFGELSQAASLADFAKLTLTSDEAKSLAERQARRCPESQRERDRRLQGARGRRGRGRAGAAQAHAAGPLPGLPRFRPRGHSPL